MRDMGGAGRASANGHVWCMVRAVNGNRDEMAKKPPTGAYSSNERISQAQLLRGWCYESRHELAPPAGLGAVGTILWRLAFVVLFVVLVPWYLCHDAFVRKATRHTDAPHEVRTRATLTPSGS